MSHYTECPMCLVTVSPDSFINQIRDLLDRTTTMLDASLCPKIDHEEAKAWIDQRNALVEEAKVFLEGEDNAE